MILPLFVFAVISTPTPQPTASPALKTIASVHASSRCADIITHANSAIGTTFDNDMVLGKTIAMLRGIDLDDGNPIHRRNGLNALGDLAKKLMLQARAGDDEIKHLRVLAAAAKTKDPNEAKDLKDFADELGGALWRQQRIARDLNGYLAYEDFRDMAQWDEGQEQMNRAVFGVADPLTQSSPFMQGSRLAVPFTPHLGHDPNEPTSTQYARAAADDFQNRIPDILLDENHAAGHVDGALAGCAGQ